MTGQARDAAIPRRYGDCPAWEKALRTIVLSGEMGIPVSALVLVARKALEDEGVPYEETPV